MTPSPPPRFIDCPEDDSPAVFDQPAQHGQLPGAAYECIEHGCGITAVFTDGAYSDRTVGWRVEGKLIGPATRPIPDWFTDHAAEQYSSPDDVTRFNYRGGW